MVIAYNAIGFGNPSNTGVVIPYGGIQITGVVVNGKQVTITINPNGSLVQRVVLFATDNDPNENSSDMLKEWGVGQIPSQISSPFTLSNTFTSFSGNVSFYMAIANKSDSVAFTHN